MNNTFKACKDCKDRYQACHDKCDKYLHEKREHLEKQEKLKQAKHNEDIYKGFLYANHERIKKELRRKNR